ncbi:MAG TPA: hypothetical protein VJM46_01210 [Candidatus Saccharimonadales bacterium]|nr:hypothetical protein [Candidatus Saccharimonadales bacterium]
MTIEVVRYRLGAPIDTSKILEIKGLPNAQWGSIEEAYPEVRAAGSDASFRSAANVTIFPPSYASQALLTRLLGLSDDTHVMYGFPTGTRQPTSVLAHVIGGYASIHIYRLSPPRRRNRRR